MNCWFETPLHICVLGRMLCVVILMYRYWCVSKMYCELSVLCFCDLFDLLNVNLWFVLCNQVRCLCIVCFQLMLLIFCVVDLCCLVNTLVCVCAFSCFCVLCLFVLVVMCVWGDPLNMVYVSMFLTCCVRCSVACYR